jgi:formate-dependent nitrite reductase membrane component NrfD
LLVLELGSFEAGHWFKWLNLYRVMNLSPMSVGTWLLTFFMMLSIVYAYTFWRGDPFLGDFRYTLRKPLAWIMVPMGIAVAIYTGVLLGAMPSRPFWNSPILALLFFVSALSTGVAVILLARALFTKQKMNAKERRQFEDSNYLLTASDAMLIGFELLVVFLFIMFAYLTVGDVRAAVSVILWGGSLAIPFWLLFVALGLLIPVLIELIYVIPKLLYHKAYSAPRSIEILVAVIILIGGFVLRYVVVVAGQITGPVGI